MMTRTIASSSLQVPSLLAFTWKVYFQEAPSCSALPGEFPENTQLYRYPPVGNGIDFHWGL